MENDAVTYCVNAEDIIISFSENWQAFARENGWEGDSGDMVIGRLLWDFIEDHETMSLYESILHRVRQGMRIGPIPFRCDSPFERRFLELLLTPQADGQVLFSSTLVRREPRDPVSLIDKKAPRSNELLKICSMCKKILLSQNEWVEIEEGLTRLKLFEGDAMPGLTHGICPACYKLALSELEGL